MQKSVTATTLSPAPRSKRVSVSDGTSETTRRGGEGKENGRPRASRITHGVYALMGAVALVQVWLAHHHFGLPPGDDVEVLAAAFRRAFGFEYAPWDVRNLFVPDVIVAPVLRLANAVGVVSPARLLEIAALPL